MILTKEELAEYKERTGQDANFISVFEHESLDMSNPEDRRKVLETAVKVCIDLESGELKSYPVDFGDSSHPQKTFEELKEWAEVKN